MATAAGFPAEEFELHEQYEIGEQVGLWTDTWRRLRRNKLAVIGMFFVALVVSVDSTSVVGVDVVSAFEPSAGFGF